MRLNQIWIPENSRQAAGHFKSRSKFSFPKPGWIHRGRKKTFRSHVSQMVRLACSRSPCLPPGGRNDCLPRGSSPPSATSPRSDPCSASVTRIRLHAHSALVCGRTMGKRLWRAPSCSRCIRSWTVSGPIDTHNEIRLDPGPDGVLRNLSLPRRKMPSSVVSAISRNESCAG